MLYSQSEVTYLVVLLQGEIIGRMQLTFPADDIKVARNRRRWYKDVPRATVELDPIQDPPDGSPRLHVGRWSARSRAAELDELFARCSLADIDAARARKVGAP